MQFKKLALTLTLSAAFGLMACGDDSSSGPSNSDSGSELQKEFQEVQKEMMEGLEKLGKCTEDNAGEEKSVTVKGKDYKVVCEDGEWESDELDDLIEDYEKRIAEENGKHIDGKGCNFKKTDKVWSYNVSTDLYDEGTTHVISMEFEGTTLVETSINTVSGGSISTACKYMSEDDMHDSEQIDKTKTHETYVKCEGDKIITTDITKTTNALNEEHDRDFYFEQFMSECKMINGIEDEEDEEDDDDSSSSEEEDLSSSSNGDVPNVGPSGDDPAASVTNCDEMIYENDVWKVTSTLAVTNMTTIVTYEWEELKLHQYMEMKTKMESQEECEQILASMPSETGASCDGKMLIEKMDHGTSEYESEEDKKEFFDFIMSAECSEKGGSGDTGTLIAF